MGVRIYSALKCRQQQAEILVRVKALKNLMVDAQRKVGYIQRATDMINRHGLNNSVRRTNDNIYALTKLVHIEKRLHQNTFNSAFSNG